MKLWDLRARGFDPLQEIDDFKDSVTHIDLNNQQLLISCLDKRVRLYDLRFGRLQCDYMGEPVTCSNLSKDEQCILTSLLANRLVLLDKLSGEMLNEYTGHVNRVYQLENCLNNSSSLVYSGSEDGHVYIWDLVDTKIKQKLKHLSEKTVHSLSFHPEKDKLLSAQENFVYLWNATTSEN